MSMQPSIEDLAVRPAPSKRGRKKGGRNRPGHKAGRPPKQPEELAPSVWAGGTRRITVTQRHIAEAVARSSSACAIAEALREQIPTAKRIGVDLQCIRWSDVAKNVRYVALTPGPAQALIVAFDQGERERLRPISVALRPSFVFKVGARRKHAPEQHELKGTGIRAPEQPESPLARAMLADAAVVARRERTLDRAQERPPRQQRRMLSAPSPNGLLPATLGGAAPPISALATRSFGLRALRR